MIFLPMGEFFYECSSRGIVGELPSSAQAPEIGGGTTCGIVASASPAGPTIAQACEYSEAQMSESGTSETNKLGELRAGYPILEHDRRIVEGPIVWAPGLTGAVVVSLRGGDFELVVGRDFSIGYLDHDAKRVRPYIEESFTFRLLSPQAAVPLAYEANRQRPPIAVRT
jgi:hypothetical protein